MTPSGSCPSCGAPLPEGTTVCGECATMTVGPFEPAPPSGAPQKIGGYTILRELGAGGMGSVFEAFEEKMQRKVALKVLARQQSVSESGSHRFEREAWIAGRLDHPNLVKVYDRGTVDDVSFYSMELVDGGSLHDVLHNMQQWGRDGRWGLEFGSREYAHWAISQVITAARALDYAHRQGVVHRDIKPMNLLLGREQGAVKIADFGLAFEVEATRLTTAGKMLGTISYMSPEQILGKQKEVDARTDIYALGVTLFQLLTLELPFAGKTQEMYINAVLSTEARRPSKLNERVGRDLEIVIRKALEKSPHDRYETAAAFADDLENVLNLRPILARPPSRASRTWKWMRRKPIHAALLATLILSAPTIGLLAYRASGQRQALRQVEVEQLWNELRWLAQRSRHQESLAVAERILDIDASHAGALRQIALARMLAALDAEDPSEAAVLREESLAAISRVVELQPDAAWPHRMKAYILGRFDRTEESAAEEALAARLRSDEPAADELYFDARLAHDSGDYRKALELASQLIVQGSNSQDHYALRAMAYEDKGDTGRAIEDYSIAKALSPQVHYNYIDLGRLHTDRGELEEGESFLRRALELKPDSALARENLAYNLTERGRTASEREAALGYFRQAEKVAREALELDPDLRWAAVNLGASLLERHRLEESSDTSLIVEAAGYFERATAGWTGSREDPGFAVYFGALNNTCDAYIKLRRLDRALEVCTRVVEMDPDNAIPHYNLAGVHALAGREDEAFAELSRDVELGDTDWVYLQEDPWFESLRSDPRFDAIIERMKRAAQ